MMMQILKWFYTAVDKTIASYVNQYTKIFDHYGKLVDSEVKTFDLEKSVFPEFDAPNKIQRFLLRANWCFI